MKSVATKKYVRPLCPKIQKKLDAIIIDATRCCPKHAGGPKYQVVIGPANQHVVDLNYKTCLSKKGSSVEFYAFMLF